MNAVPPFRHHALLTMPVELAHRIMQEHVDGPVTVCAIKSQAKTVLVHHKRLAPASRVKFGY
ncbi:hypothetical protein GV794_05445 [Nocardia cyriacigeorgica]|uniref:Uncharacterized protein n=1 Tax=Nocardia cyriacigeorgica TaxID=135487 RepID=A0A6P1D6C4_9NOCA|nr:hypothetical protein [Nocardia cyriacigeorgica]NEW37606.1 hypothetical protein [Nocardia cyriacigeorgica]NEW45051.1 hypothetical protein [Nocardia cyriacigeorgica]NEW49006.1 hypothetical protein [Nocardia cyriacigeorgica]NEW55107.1 hypothetical protein [Nocardia cyriacigeorgica]